MGYGDGAYLGGFTEGAHRARVREDQLKTAEQARDLSQRRDARAEEQMNMQRDLYQRQRKLFEDEQARQEYMRGANRAMATFRATAGQVYQPAVDFYNENMPDGGRINMMTRNPDGTFDFEYDANGKRIKQTGVSADDVGGFFMALGDPQGYISHHNAMKLQAAEAIAERELERYKSDLKNRQTPEKYTNAYDKFSEAYVRAFGGDALTAPPEGVPSHDEWVAQRMREAGFVGAAVGEGGGGGGKGTVDEAKEALRQAFASREAFLNWMAAGGRSANDIAKSGDAGAMWLADVDNAFGEGGERLEELVRDRARALKVPLTDEDVAEIVSNAKLSSAVSGETWQDTAVASLGALSDMAGAGLRGAQGLVGAGLDALHPYRQGPGAALDFAANRGVPPQPAAGGIRDPALEQASALPVEPPAGKDYYQQAYNRR